jgi:hypothetical protein
MSIYAVPWAAYAYCAATIGVACGMAAVREGVYWLAERYLDITYRSWPERKW